MINKPLIYYKCPCLGLFSDIWSCPTNQLSLSLNQFHTTLMTTMFLGLLATLFLKNITFSWSFTLPNKF